MLQRYIVSYTDDRVTVADLEELFTNNEIIHNRLYAAAPKTVYERTGPRGTRLHCIDGHDTSQRRRAAHRIFYGYHGWLRQKKEILPADKRKKV